MAKMRRALAEKFVRDRLHGKLFVGVMELKRVVTFTLN
jgi:hypothetical protein